jgi:hypothetical protein
MSEFHGVPSMIGEVNIRSVDPRVSPEFDMNIDVRIKQVEPTEIPSLADEAPVVQSVSPPEATLSPDEPMVSKR